MGSRPGQWFLVIAICTVVASDLFAQTGLPSIKPGFSVLSWDGGGRVSGKFATAMARTPDGYLWLRTALGLIRFDGVRFVTLTPNATRPWGTIGSVVCWWIRMESYGSLPKVGR